MVQGRDRQDKPVADGAGYRQRARLAGAESVADGCGSRSAATLVAQGLSNEEVAQRLFVRPGAGAAPRSDLMAAASLGAILLRKGGVAGLQDLARLAGVVDRGLLLGHPGPTQAQAAGVHRAALPLSPAQEGEQRLVGPAGPIGANGPPRGPGRLAISAR